MAPMTINTGDTGFMLLCCSLVMLMTPGAAVRIAPISQFGHPRAFIFSGIILGTTASIIVKQKSPHSSQAKRINNPALV